MKQNIDPNKVKQVIDLIVKILIAISTTITAINI